MRGVTSLIGGFSYLRIDFDCEYTYNNINNVVDITACRETQVKPKGKDLGFFYIQRIKTR